MKNHNISMSSTIFYNEPSVVQEGGIYEYESESRSSELIARLVFNRRLKVHNTNTIKAEYYEVEPEVHEDLSESCDSIVNHMIDKNNMRELVELKNLTGFKKYLDFVSRKIGCDMCVSLGAAKYDIDAMPDKPHIIIQITEPEEYNKLPVRYGLIPPHIWHKTVCACRFGVSLNIPSERDFSSEEYEKYCCLLKKFSDTFVGNITKAKRILLMD